MHEILAIGMMMKLHSYMEAEVNLTSGEIP